MQNPSRAPRVRPAEELLAVLGLLAACTGSVEGPIGPGGALGGGGGAVGGADDGTAPPPAAFEPAPAALRKLTVAQYENTVRDLLGPDVTLPQELEQDSAVNGFVAIGAAKATISPLGVERFEEAAYALAAQALAEGRRAAFVGCTPQGVTDAACTRDFLARFGLRAFRRPLSDDELARYQRVAEAAQTKLGDFYQGLEFAVAGILQSPHFLFRVELGERDPEVPERRKFNDYELATRLAYMLWNSTPDDALLDAAARGELSRPDGLRAQAERLLADDRARGALDTFHSERLALEGLSTLDKHPSVYSEVTDSLREAMRRDVLSTIEDFTFGSERDFRDLFTTRTAFVNAELAALYGIRGEGRVELSASSPRVGLLGKAAYLALNAHLDSTSPTLRGKYIRERILCQSIAAPPPNVVAVLPEPNADAPTLRERLLPHAEQAGCASCHRMMDPLGLSLEHFDAVGRYRADENGYAIDASGDLDGQPFDGLAELAELLHDDPRASECVVRHVYRYAVAHVETKGEAAAIGALHEAFVQSGYQFVELLKAVVTSEGFRYAAAGE